VPGVPRPASEKVSRTCWSGSRRGRPAPRAATSARLAALHDSAARCRATARRHTAGPSAPWSPPPDAAGGAPGCGGRKTCRNGEKPPSMRVRQHCRMPLGGPPGREAQGGIPPRPEALGANRVRFATTWGSAQFGAPEEKPICRNGEKPPRMRVRQHGRTPVGAPPGRETVQGRPTGLSRAAPPLRRPVPRRARSRPAPRTPRDALRGAERAARCRRG
jgi:hypothetical protein